MSACRTSPSSPSPTTPRSTSSGSSGRSGSRRSRNQISEARGLKKPLEEWEIPRERPKDWPLATESLIADFWKARIARQQEIDKSIAAKAEFEYLYDKPYTDNKKVRVAGPFTVESLSPHRVLGVDENEELIDPSVAEKDGEYGAKQSFPQMILEDLKERRSAAGA